jgi:hypothetical protein
MKCKSCTEEIPSKFAHAISVNICPLCGKEIMDTKLQSILNDLSNIFNESKDYMKEIEDWLASNFQLKKFDPNEMPANFSSTVVKPGKGVAVLRRDEDDQGDDVGDDTEMSVFAKRAGVKKPKAVKKAVDFIKNGTGAADPEDFVGEDDESGMIVDMPVSKAPLSSNEKYEMENMFDTDNSKLEQMMELEKLKRLRNNPGGTSFGREG